MAIVTLLRGDHFKQWLHAYRLPDRVAHGLYRVLKRSGNTVGVGAFDDHGKIWDFDLPGRAESHSRCQKLFM